jgi:hypothetical protein
MKKLIPIIGLIIVISSCKEEEDLSPNFLLSANSSKTWITTDATSDDDIPVLECSSDDIWICEQNGWRDVDWVMVSKPGFLKCDLEEQSTMWNWRFDSDFKLLYLVSVDGDMSMIRKFEIMELTADEMILREKIENTWGDRLTYITYTFRAE